MSDTSKLVKKLKRCGCDITVGGKGHYKIYWQGNLITTLAATPGCRRGLANARAKLRRAGIDI